MSDVAGGAVVGAAMTGGVTISGTTTWVAASVEPVERPGQNRPPDNDIGPGIVGFLVTFGVAVALVFLVRDMNRRVQRLRYGRGGDRDGDGGATTQSPPGDSPGAPGPG